MTRPALTADYAARLYPCHCGCARESHLVTAGAERRRGACGRCRTCSAYRSAAQSTRRAA
jgi:hypothetical protein